MGGDRQLLKCNHVTHLGYITGDFSLCLCKHMARVKMSEITPLNCRHVIVSSPNPSSPPFSI